MRVLLVCTGNTCRSSMAEALAKKWLKQNAPDRTDIEILSAGLAAFPGNPASPQAVQVMQASGIDLSGHRARQISGELVRGCDIVLTMTRGHKQALCQMFPALSDRIRSLAEFALGQTADISDPYSGSAEVYRLCAGEIEKFLEPALQKILNYGIR